MSPKSGNGIPANGRHGPKTTDPMMTMADGGPDWPTVYRILTQSDFEPNKLVLESCVAGFMRRSVRKRVFLDIMAVACFNFKYALTSHCIPRWNVLINRYGVGSISYDNWYSNLRSFILETPYFDKWLKAYRLTSIEKFETFCKYALSTWSRDSRYRYEDSNPELKTDELKAAWIEFAYDIINKTKKLLGKEENDDGNK